MGDVRSDPGSPYPKTDLDKACQPVDGGHHDAITGSKSDQVYLDLLAGWREAFELASDAHDAAIRYPAGRVHAFGDGWALRFSTAWPGGATTWCRSR